MRASTPAGIVTLAVAAAFAAPARAQVSAQSAAAAEALFTEARALLAEGKVDAACSKFEESRKLDPSAMGTLFNLALCNEQRGRIATAWVQHREVLAASRATRPDRAALAEQRIAALEPKLSRLKVEVPVTTIVDGLEVTLDDVPVRPSSFGTPIPVDGGNHVIRAAAPSYAQYMRQIDVPAEGGNLSVTLPPLTPLPRAPEPPPSATPPAKPEPDRVAPSGSSNAGLGWVIGAAGVGALALGAGFGVAYLVNVHDAQTRIDQSPESYAKEKGDLPSAQAWIANVSLPVGAVLTGIGAYLVISSSPSGGHGSQARIAPRVGGSRAANGVDLHLSF